MTIKEHVKGKNGFKWEPVSSGEDRKYTISSTPDGFFIEIPVEIKVVDPDKIEVVVGSTKTELSKAAINSFYWGVARSAPIRWEESETDGKK